VGRERLERSTICFDRGLFVRVCQADILTRLDDRPCGFREWWGGGNKGYLIVVGVFSGWGELVVVVSYVRLPMLVFLHLGLYFLRGNAD